MSSMKHTGLVLLAAIAVMLASCAKPRSYEEFIKLNNKSEDGMYHFALDLSDSLCTYNLWFYSRIDCNNVRMAELRDFPMEITWVSPTGLKYKEKVYFPIHSGMENSDFYTNQYRIPYRMEIDPREHGAWELAVSIDADDHIPGFRGLGIICEKN